MFSISIIAPLIIMGLTGLTFSTAYIIDILESRKISKNEDQIIAKNFLLYFSAFKFSIIRKSVKLHSLSQDPTSQCSKFTFTFDCQSKYSTKVINQNSVNTITHHKMEILVDKGKIISAVIDNSRNELHQIAS